MATSLPDIEPTHPGEILKDDFMEELGLTCYGVAKACGIPRTRIERVYRGERPITADTALRLERCLGVSANFWLGLQAQYDIDVARRELGDALDDVEQLNAPAEVEAVSDAVTKRVEKSVAAAINHVEKLAKQRPTKASKILEATSATLSAGGMVLDKARTSTVKKRSRRAAGKGAA